MLKHFISARLNCHNGRLRIFIIFYLFEEGVARESTRKAMRRSGQRARRETGQNSWLLH